MQFNVDKYKVLHFGNNNPYTKYTMNGSELSKVSYRKDLWVTISKDFKHSKHSSVIVMTGNKLVGFIGRTFKHKSVKVISTLFNAFVHSPSSKILHSVMVTIL